MPKIIITPWRDESELLDVRSKFYPSSSLNSTPSPDLRPDACRIVEAWKLRGHLPHAVEATALLTDAILHDDATHNSVFSIRATYAAAFSRFVTGLVDTKLGSGGGGGTMFNRASMIGLPLSFVELRHEAAHRELPSLVLLRSYTNRALEWLWDYYWIRKLNGNCILDVGSRFAVYYRLSQNILNHPH
ncbi:cell morphogenesis protein [Talaromyces pinophilus]|uniref:Cell morphogenesis protein n=1 Tax=Talaromyces pinophilus TaxID=128442 RepID=A0A6V8GZU3_TALPI|nr:cell morphogenesis protein [Talaromyces pinophilus]